MKGLRSWVLYGVAILIALVAILLFAFPPSGPRNPFDLLRILAALLPIAVDLYFRSREKSRRSQRHVKETTKTCSEEIVETTPDGTVRRTKKETREHTVTRHATYLDGLPSVSDPAVKDPFEAGRKLMEECKWAEAVAEFRKALPHGIGTQLVALYNLIGLCYYTSGKLDYALASYEKSLTLATEFQDGPGEAAALGNIGLILRDRGQTQAAEQYFQKALKVSEQVGYEQGRAEQLNNLGLISLRRGNLDEAKARLTEALEMDRRAGNVYGMAVATENLGVILQHEKRYAEALDHFRSALSHYGEATDEPGRATCLVRVGQMLLLVGKPGEAKQAIQDALLISRTSNFRQGEAMALGVLGLISQTRGALDESLSYQRDSLRVSLEIGYDYGAAKQHTNIGIALTTRGQADEALSHLLAAMRMWVESGDTSETSTALKQVALLYEMMGREQFLGGCQRNGMSRTEAEELVKKLGKD